MGVQRWIVGAAAVGWVTLAGPAAAKAQAPEVRITEHASGAKASECAYVGDRRHGPCTSWFEDGTKESAGDYREGQRHGPWVIWVRRDPPFSKAALVSKLFGTTGEEGMVDVFGDDSGVSIDEALAGAPAPPEPPPLPITGGPRLPDRYREEGAYDAGSKVGTWRGFHESGTKLYEGQFDLMMMASEDGTWSVVGPPPPEGDPPCRQGTWTWWYDTGATMRVEVHRNGGPHGPVQGYYPSGAKKFEGTWSMSVEHGAWTYWHEDGSLRASGPWEHSEAMGRWTFYRLGGAKRAEGWIEAGTPSGEWTFWTPEGEATTRTLVEEGF